MAQKVKIDGLAEAVMKELTEYADLATVDMKAAVKKAGNTVKKQIQSTAPKDTGAYSKSWSVKNTKETSKSLEVTVYSRNRYQLAHLLEFGHAKRGGGRVAGRSHIVPAEEAGIKEGDEIDVKLMDIDPKTGKFKLSRKVLLPKPEKK